jgi:hypothetical protein
MAFSKVIVPSFFQQVIWITMERIKKMRYMRYIRYMSSISMRYMRYIRYMSSISMRYIRYIRIKKMRYMRYIRYMSSISIACLPKQVRTTESYPVFGEQVKIASNKISIILHPYTRTVRELQLLQYFFVLVFLL